MLQSTGIIKSPQCNEGAKKKKLQLNVVIIYITQIPQVSIIFQC